MSGKMLGKVILVTGGSSGIGEAAAKRLADDGALVVVGDLSVVKEQVSNEKVTHIGLDVANPEVVERVIDRILLDYGRLDCVVHSAGIARETPFLETSVDTFEQILKVNLQGTFVVGQTAARAMAKTGGGTIVNIGSVSGMIANGQRAGYGSSKGGMIQLSKIMAVELATYNIRVNVVAPGPIETPMVTQWYTDATRKEWLDRLPIQRFGTPGEVAAAIAFLASDDASFITGHVLVVDGGFLIRGLDNSRH